MPPEQKPGSGRHKRTAPVPSPVPDQKAPAIPAAGPTGGPGNHPVSGCPGSPARSIPREIHNGNRGAAAPVEPELRQWPVQLALLNPAAPYFENADLLTAADCVPFAYAGFHADFLRGRIAIVFCPKLDPDIEAYIDKLAEIFTRHEIRSIILLHMEVPCCSGVRHVIDKALERSEKKIPVSEKTVTIEGGIR